MSSVSQDAIVRSRTSATTLAPLLVLIGAAALFVQVLRIRSTSVWVEHSEEAITKCVEVERRVREQKSAVLRRLLGIDTREEELSAQTRSVEALNALERHVADNEGQVDQVRELRSLHGAWATFAAKLGNGMPGGERPTSVDVEQLKSVFDPVVAALTVLEREERRLRGVRLTEQRAAIDITLYGALPLLFFLTLVVGWYARNQMFKLAEDFGLAMEGQELARRELDAQNWVQSNLARLIASTRDEPGLSVLGEKFLDIISEATGAALGTFYCLSDIDHRWMCHAKRGLLSGAVPSFVEGESLVGQAGKVTSLTHLRALPESYFFVQSGTGQGHCREAVFIPCHHDGETHAVLELGFFAAPTERDLRLMRAAGESMGIALAVTRKRLMQRKLLVESKRQGEALQAQQEELRVTNEELASRSDALRLAHAQLEERKEELEASNADLVRQRDALAVVREDLAARAVELLRANRYKSEFLASMSHELRTPLNSCLILSKALADNKGGNLTQEQVKFAETIHASGADLLELINAVLDLSKIEAGAVELAYEKLTLQALVRPVARIVEPIAMDRGLTFELDLPRPDLRIETDPVRVQQILKNLLSNACKFTSKGKVELRVRASDDRVAFDVVDSGIGISHEHLENIFEAFRQADGTTSRKFGGTGLGLTISRDLATRLGGNIVVHSEVGVGSTFTLTVPLRAPAEPPPTPPRQPSEPPASRLASSQTDELRSNQRVLLVERHEDGRVMLNDWLTSVNAHLMRATSAEEARKMLAEAAFTCVVLDLDLPDGRGDDLLRSISTGHTLDGPRVLIHTGRELTPSQEAELLQFADAVILEGPKSEERLIDELSRFLAARIQSAAEHSEKKSWRQSVTGALRGRRVLLVEDDVRNVYALTSVLEKEGILVEVARNGREALSKLETVTQIELVLMDIMMPEMNGLEATKAIRESSHPWRSIPIIAITAKAMRDDKNACLEAGANDYVTKPLNIERLVSLMKIWLQRT